MSLVVSPGPGWSLSHTVCPTRLPLSLSFGSKQQLVLRISFSVGLQHMQSPYLEPPLLVGCGKFSLNLNSFTSRQHRLRFGLLTWTTKVIQQLAKGPAVG